MKRFSIILLLIVFSSCLLTSCDNSPDPQEKPKKFNFKSSIDLRNEMNNFKAVFSLSNGSTYYILEDNNYIFTYSDESDEFKYLYHKNDRYFYNVTSTGKSRIATDNEAADLISVYINPYFDNYLALASTFEDRLIEKGDNKLFLGRVVEIYTAYEVKQTIIFKHIIYVDEATGATIYCETYTESDGAYENLVSTWQLTTFETGSVNISKLIT